MRYLLLLCFITIFICFGYFIMVKVDIFLADGGFVVEDISDPTAIVLGNNDLAEQVGVLLEKNKFQVTRTTTPFPVNYEKGFQLAFALSENDADNLVFYKIGTKIYGMKKIISICNDYRNKRLFDRENVPCIYALNATAKILYEAALQTKEEKL